MLKNRVALITGASRGIGKAIALRMAADGADIAVLYAGDEDAALQTVEEIAACGVRVRAYRCDVSDPEQAKRCVDSVLEEFGGLDILVNNAGITRDKLLLHMTPEDFRRVTEVNLYGAFHMVQSSCRHFVKKRYGRIINISSVSGLLGNAGQANYAASKAGLIGFTKTTARELASRGVTCNAIAPGFIQTDMTDGMNEQAKEQMLRSIPSGRPGTPGDVAALALFLAQEEASYITGEVIRVDGGLAI